MSARAEVVLETARRGELHHAVILWGPSPDALRTLALGIAKALNCLNGTTGDRCTACDRIQRRLHPDLHLIEVGGEKKMISIEQIRELVSGATLRPYEGRNKVFIVDPADALSISGSNSLLKTLEEPARNTHFILLTRSPDLLLPTIKSRCQHIHIGGPEPRNEELAQRIEEALTRYAERGDSAALLAIAAIVSSEENLKDAIALFASVACELAASGRLGIPRERLLAAADTALGAIRWLNVNADARLLMEQVVAALVA